MNDSIDYKIVTENIVSEVEPQLRVLENVIPTWSLVLLLMVTLLLVVGRKFFKNLLAAVSYIALLALIIQKTVLVFSGNSTLYGNSGFYIDVCVFIAAYLIVQHLVVYFIGWLFGDEEAAIRHSMMHIEYARIIDMPLLVLALVAVFYPMKFFLVLSLVIIIGNTFVRIIKTFFEVQILTKVNLFQNFLYFCTLEIMPLSVAVTMLVRLIATDCIL